MTRRRGFLLLILPSSYTRPPESNRAECCQSRKYIRDIVLDYRPVLGRERHDAQGSLGEILFDEKTSFVRKVSKSSASATRNSSPFFGFLLSPENSRDDLAMTKRDRALP